MSQPSLQSVNHRIPRWALLVGLLVLLTGVFASWTLHRLQLETEQVAVKRYLDRVSEFVRSDILTSTMEHAQAQSRMALRLGQNSLVDEPGWRLEASAFQSHYPYYRGLAVVDTDFRVLWLEHNGPVELAENEIVVVDPLYRQRLREALDTGELVVTRTAWLPDRQPGIFFFQPILQDDQPLGYLLAVMVVPQAIDRMLPVFYRDDVVIQVVSRGMEVFPLAETAQPPRIGPQSRFVLDADDDGVGFEFLVHLSPTAIDQLTTPLPFFVLGMGVLLSILLAIGGVLAISAGRQAHVLAEANQRLTAEVRDREQAERELEYLAIHDPLTGLPNRTGITRHLERTLDGFDPARAQLGVLFLDLDQFKDINDTLGHQLGDSLLSQIPDRLMTVLREQDFVGRHGGDEFLIVVMRDSREQIESLAGRLLRSLDDGFEVGDHRLFISASIGIAFCPEGGQTVSELIQNADTALFRAKHAGRNQHALFTRELFGQVQHRLNLSRDIRQALDAEEFSLVYQPIIGLEDFSLRGLEALLRWQHRDGYAIPPSEFIRIAEETGIIARLSEYAMTRALSDLADWQKRFGETPFLAVNISGAQIRQVDFAEQISVLLHQHRIDPRKLHLEITEEVLIENLVRNRKSLERLNGIGVQIVVDDFGIGYSSLAYLKNFPVSVVKIDRSFVRDLTRDGEDQAITRTICSLAADLGMLTVAEGVETPEQLALLRQYHCNFSQGFLFSRPIAAHAVEELLSGRLPWADLCPESL